MADESKLRAQVDAALKAGKPGEAICYLAELVSQNPDDRFTRTALAIALGDAGNPAGALRILRALADRLAHDGFLHPAMIVIRHGLEHAPNDAGLLTTLKRIHVRGVRAKAGVLPVPPPLKPRKAASAAATAEALLALSGPARLERAAQAGLEFSPAGEASMPLPMPLFSELDDDAFVETVRRLRYRRVAPGTKLLVEGQSGDTLLVIASGHVKIEKAGQQLARIGPGLVLGEMALITGGPRTATAIADGEVEVFELSRKDVEQLTSAKPKVAEELVEYCRKRFIGNVLRTSPLFARFDELARFLLLDRFKRVGFQAGQALIKQGDRSAGLFVIVTGEVEVSVAKDGGESVVVANLGSGEVVGEISLLNELPATATVKARGLVGALLLPRLDFDAVLKDHPKAREYLQTLSADRLKAAKAAHASSEVLDADELIVL